MSIPTLPVLALWAEIFWVLGAILLFVLGLFLIIVVLIQESQGGGVGGAFGSAGGDSVLGARAQQGISKFTALLGAVFALLLLVLSNWHPDRELTYEGDTGAGEPAVGPAEEGESGQEGAAVPPPAPPGTSGAGATTDPLESVRDALEAAPGSEGDTGGAEGGTDAVERILEGVEGPGEGGSGDATPEDGAGPPESGTGATTDTTDASSDPSGGTAAPSGDAGGAEDPGSTGRDGS